MNDLHNVHWDIIYYSSKLNDNLFFSLENASCCFPSFLLIFVMCFQNFSEFIKNYVDVYCDNIVFLVNYWDNRFLHS